VSSDVRRLVLVRHAKTPTPEGVPDHERALGGRGRRDAAAVGRWLVEAGLVPDLVLCSDATRAAQTWDAAARAFPTPVTVQLEAKLYEASPQAVVHLVAGLGDEVRTAVVVGHEPTMSAVADALAGPGSDGALLAQVRADLPTSGVVVLELDGAWDGVQAGACRLVALATPRG
jgi:phosphohistidine phosphatase